MVQLGTGEIVCAKCEHHKVMEKTDSAYQQPEHTAADQQDDKHSRGKKADRRRCHDGMVNGDAPNRKNATSATNSHVPMMTRKKRKTRRGKYDYVELNTDGSFSEDEGLVLLSVWWS